MKYSRIAGTGSYLPEKILTNAELEKMVATTDEWIVERTGIRERHIIGPNDSTASMATAAAKNALSAANVAAKDIGLIIVATSTPDKFFPSTACLVQAALGEDGCPAFDIVAACAGFNYALSVADQFIRNGVVQTALVIGSESMSNIINWEDRSTCILFGDGAGAVVLQAASEPGIISAHLHAAGSYKDLLSLGTGLKKDDVPHLKMQGSDVFKIAVKKLSAVLEETLAANKIDKKDIDWLIPHQANLRISQFIQSKFKLTDNQVYNNIQKYGNTTAASIPIALTEAWEQGKIKSGDLVVLAAFGSGFTWGSVIIRW